MVVIFDGANIICNADFKIDINFILNKVMETGIINFFEICYYY